MKLNHPAKRLTAALLSGAMLFALSAPALAAGADAAPDAAPAALSEENSTDPAAADYTLILTWYDTPYTLTPDSYELSSPVPTSLPMITYENGVYKISLPASSDAGAGVSSPHLLTLKGAGGQLPAVELTTNGCELQKLDVTDLKSFSADSVWVYFDAAFTNPGDVTITGGLDLGNSCTITNAHDVKISNSNGAAVSGSTTTPGVKFSVDASGDVIITSENGNAIGIFKTEIKADGKAEIKADGSSSGDIYAIRSDISSVTAGGDVSIVNNGFASDSNQAFAIYGGSSTISAGGNVKISSETDRAVHVRDSFAIKNAHDVDITGSGQAAVYVPSAGLGSSFTVKATGDVKIHNNGASASGSTSLSSCAILSDTISIQTDGAVSISTDGSGVTVQQANGNSSSSTFDVVAGGDVKIQGGAKAIQCRHAAVSSGGTVDISSAIDVAYFEIEKAQDVKITSETSSAIHNNYSSTIQCSGDVEIKGSDDAIKTNQFAIDQAKDVTITSASGSVFSGYSSSGSMAYHSPTASIVCSGTVELTAGSDKPVVREDPDGTGEEAMLIYRPTADSTEYAVYAGSSAAAAAKLDGVGAAGTSYSVSSRTGNVSPDGGNTPSFYSYVKIAPPAPIIPDEPVPPVEPTDTDDGTFAIVAGVAIGGAAAWGSYEIATRVILNDLLPEGAAIPANRGQLALLVWNTAGRPAPAAAPAFTDVADPDTAAAAQWCAEQGLLDAKKDGSFDPDGWTPKFRVIEVWNKAFPKQ